MQFTWLQADRSHYFPQITERKREASHYRPASAVADSSRKAVRGSRPRHYGKQGIPSVNVFVCGPELTLHQLKSQKKSGDKIRCDSVFLKIPGKFFLQCKVG